MNIYLEIFGYIGSVLLIISMMMTSLVKLRIINIIGSIISTIYSVVYGAYAVVFLNIGMISMNVLQLVRSLRSRTAFSCIKTDINDASVVHFLNFYKNDIKKLFPQADVADTKEKEIFLIYSNAEPVGVMIGSRFGNTMHIDIDYTAPKFSDGTLAKYIYPALKDTGLTRFTASKNSTALRLKHLSKMGFSAENDLMVKNTLTEDTV